jgi:hypothetical protein
MADRRAKSKAALGLGRLFQELLVLLFVIHHVLSPLAVDAKDVKKV